MKKLISLFVALALICTSVAVFAADVNISVTYQGQQYFSGSSIHYQSGSSVTVIISSNVTGFDLYVDGILVKSTTTSSMEYPFNNVSGSKTLKIVANSGTSNDFILNLYPDVYADPNATYKYKSVKAIITKVENKDISAAEISYNDGVNQTELNSLFDRLVADKTINAAAGGTYTVYGYLRVQVYVPSTNEVMGLYNCSDFQKMSGSGRGFQDLFSYNWDSGTKSGFIDRRDWSANHTYTPSNGNVYIKFVGELQDGTSTPLGNDIIPVSIPVGQTVTQTVTAKSFDQYEFLSSKWGYTEGAGTQSPNSQITVSLSASNPHVFIEFRYRALTEAPPPPPKPDDDSEPTVSIEIVPRDSNPATPSDKIYEGESINLRGYVDGGHGPCWNIYQNRQDGDDPSIMGGTGVIYGLKKIDAPADYYGEQRADYYVYEAVTVKDEKGNDTTVYVKVNKKKTAHASFLVKPIQPPEVTIDTNLSLTNFNVVHVKDKIRLVTTAVDINEPSEEHPFGFGVISNWKIYNSLTGEIVMQGNGVLNDPEFEITRGTFKANQSYTYRVEAMNDFKPSAVTIKYLDFFVENLPPQIDLSFLSGDGVEPTFAKEFFDMIFKANDVDGVISSVNVQILNDNGNLVNHGTTTVKPLNGEEYEAVTRYLSDVPINPIFRVTAYDDLGEQTTYDLRYDIVRPTVVAVVNLHDELSAKKKVNNFLRMDASNSFENAPFGIDHTKTLWQYRLNGGNLVNVSSSQNIATNEVRVYFPNYPDKSVVEFYPKAAGLLVFSLTVFDTKDFDSEASFKSLNIEDDLNPVIDYNTINVQHVITDNDVENNSGNSIAIVPANVGKGYIKLIDKSKSPDGDIVGSKVFYITYDSGMDGVQNDTAFTTTITEDSVNGYNTADEIVVNAEQNNVIQVKDINNFTLTYLTVNNGLGDYYIREKATEVISQLPSADNPLYTELINLGKSFTSNFTVAFIDNLKPKIEFQLGSEKKINLIFHFDHVMTQEERDKVNQIVQLAESKGYKVNLIIYENKY